MTLIGQLLNGSKYNPSFHLYECGSCKKFISYEMLTYWKLNPKTIDKDVVWFCPSCHKPIIKNL